MEKFDYDHPEEIAYRRGFSQGFYAAKNSDATFEQVQAWRGYPGMMSGPGVKSMCTDFEEFDITKIEALK